MKISNAIRNVEGVFSNSPDIVSDETIESVEFALEAMNKQDPMKPTPERTRYGMVYDCNVCNCGLEPHNNYCPSCGQKIDWED